MINAWRLMRAGKSAHARNIRESRRVLRHLRAMLKNQSSHSQDQDGPPMFQREAAVQAMMILQSLNPYVFEEVILSVVEDNGIMIRRNLSYSGDGGLDGQFLHAGHRVLIQCKRYGNHINREHMREFVGHVKRVRFAYKKSPWRWLQEPLGLGRPAPVWGLFAHTGKMSEETAALARNHGVQIIDGVRLLRFITLGVPLSVLHEEALGNIKLPRV